MSDDTGSLSDGEIAASRLLNQSCRDAKEKAERTFRPISGRQSMIGFRGNEADPLMVMKRPRWLPHRQELWWHEQCLLRFARQADVAAEVLNAFQAADWNWIIRDPIPRAVAGAPTQSRRHVISELNYRQRPDRLIRFGSVTGARLFWCPEAWFEQ